MTAGILAGGKSSRMGGNKALLIWKEQTLLEYLAKLLAAEPDFSQVLVSVAAADGYEEIRQRWQEDTELAFVEDLHRGYGPLEGLYRLLAHAKEEWVFVTATDMPFVNARFLRRMLKQPREGVSAVIPWAAGRVHPLCGLYKKTALPALERLFERDEHRVRALLEEIPVRYVDLPKPGIQASVLENVNTPEEYEKAKKEEACNESSSDYIQ